MQLLIDIDCQSYGIARALEERASVKAYTLAELSKSDSNRIVIDLVVTNKPDQYRSKTKNLFYAPLFVYPAYYPDLVSISESTGLSGKYHSGVLLECYRSGLTKIEAKKKLESWLQEVRRNNPHERSLLQLNEELRNSDLQSMSKDMIQEFLRFKSVEMYTDTHPKPAVFHLFAKYLCRSLKLSDNYRSKNDITDYLSYLQWGRYEGLGPIVNFDEKEEWLLRDSSRIKSRNELISYYYNIYDSTRPDVLKNLNIKNYLYNSFA